MRSVVDAISTLMLLVGRQEKQLACKPRHLLPRLNPDWFYLSATGLPGLSWKKGR